MNARNIIQASVIAALFAAGAAAQASPLGDSDSQESRPLQVHSTQSFAQARAASLASAPRHGLANFDEAYGEGVLTTRHGQLDRADVRAAAIRASHSGASEQGEGTSF